jgi:hypothetical protein
MAPRVDRPVVRASPPGGARFSDSQESGERPISDLERNTEIVRTSGTTPSGPPSLGYPTHQGLPPLFPSRLGGREPFQSWEILPAIAGSPLRLPVCTIDSASTFPLVFRHFLRPQDLPIASQAALPGFPPTLMAGIAWDSLWIVWCAGGRLRNSACQLFKSLEIDRFPRPPATIEHDASPARHEAQIFRVGPNSPPLHPDQSPALIYRPANTPRLRIALPRTHPSNLARNGASNRWNSTDFRRRWPRSNTTRLLLARKPGSPALGRTVPRSLPIISPASYIAQQTLPDYV